MAPGLKAGGHPFQGFRVAKKPEKAPAQFVHE